MATTVSRTKWSPLKRYSFQMPLARASRPAHPATGNTSVGREISASARTGTT